MLLGVMDSFEIVMTHEEIVDMYCFVLFVI